MLAAIFIIELRNINLADTKRVTVVTVYCMYRTNEEEEIGTGLDIHVR